MSDMDTKTAPITDRPVDFSGVLLATDLDGTFFGRHATMVERNLRAVERFKSLGGHFTCATGRLCPNIRRAIPDCAALFNAPAVTCNGAFIYDFTTETVLDMTCMNAPLLKEALALVECMNPNVGMRISTTRGYLVNANRLNPAIRTEMSSSHFVGEAQPLEAWETEGAEWYKVVLRGEYGELCAVRDKLMPLYGANFEFCASSPTFCEMQAKGCTKATGVAFVADFIARREGHPVMTVTAGDYENDLPMLREADLSGAPENALDMAKAAAKLVLCHHEEGCIAQLIDCVERHLTEKM